MNHAQVTACRRTEIKRLADRLDGDIERAGRLYKRCVRFVLRWYRWAEIDCSGNLKGWQLELHEHEGELLRNLLARLSDELREYGLHFDFPGLYPWLYDEHGNHGPELIWY